MSTCPPTRLSIVVPVLDEAALVTPFLRHVRSRVPGAELILVDGGSTDGTLTLGRPWADRALRAPRGRARQMNAGAAAASGDVLWFLHADSTVPVGAADALVGWLARQPGAVGGCFRLRILRPELIYRVSDALGNLAVDLGGFALGDHGIFCRREVFRTLGGYPEVPLMEDAEFYRQLRRRGPTRQLRPALTTSPRRYERGGRARTTLVYAGLLAAYVAGVRPPTLARWYARLLLRAGRGSAVRPSPPAPPSGNGSPRTAGPAPSHPVSVPPSGR